MSELALFNQFFNDDAFFRPSFHVIPFNGKGKDSNKSMHIDFVENEKDYVLHADLPGFKKEDIQVKIDNGVLVLEASRDETKCSDENAKYYYKERNWGKVYRSFRLPVDAGQDTAETKYVDGVLSINFPKVENAGAKKLTIA